MGHEDLFPPPKPNSRCGISRETIARTRGEGQQAPIPDLLSLAPERRGSPF